MPNFHFDELPPDRADGSSSWVHKALVITGKLGQVKPWHFLPIWAVLVWLPTPAWPEARLTAAVVTAGAMLADWAILAALPRTRRSWGPVTPPLLGLALVHMGLVLATGLLFNGVARVTIALLTNLAITGAAWYATWLEPFQIQVTRQTLHIPGWPIGAPPLRLLHISDIHYEKLSRREEKLLKLTESLHPDLIVLTGDYLNLSSVYDPEAQQGVRELLAQFEAPAGIYAVTGSPVVDREHIVPAIFDGLPIHWLDDEAVALEIHSVNVGSIPLWLVGVRNTYHEERDIAALTTLISEIPDGATRILLYHTPDLAPAAAGEGVNAYLCGHTHGGQIRLPFFGAIATSSRYGKRYEQGRIQEQGMTLYVSRGLGLEGLGAPRARFLAPPEIILWEIGA